MPDGLMGHERPGTIAACESRHEPLPTSIVGYVWRHSGKHQVGLSTLSAMVFLLSVWPLEIQRRIINDTISSGSLSAIAWLSAAYLGIAILEGGLKFGLNLYRSWVSETAVRHLRMTILRLCRCSPQPSGALEEEADDWAQAARIDAVFTLNMGTYTLKFGMNFLMNLMQHLGIAAVLGVGGWYVIQGEIDVGPVVAFVSGLAKIVDPWGDFVNWYREATVSGVKYRLIETAARQIVAATSSAARATGGALNLG